MSPGALLFLLLAWACVLGLTIWCYSRLLHADPADGVVPPPAASR